MEIKSFASGSSGNSYYISDGETPLLLECGIPIKQLEIAMNFNLSSVKGCLITHSHGDHSKCAGRLSTQGINLYASEGTFKAINLKSHRCFSVSALKQFNIGSFDILPFDVEHDASEPLGFLLQSKITKEKLLYFTDTYYIKYKFNGLTHIMGECNYDINILEENIKNGTLPKEFKNRLIQSHMSLKTFLKLLNDNDISQLQQVYLVHLSKNNGNANYFKEEIQKVTGVEVYVL